MCACESAISAEWVAGADDAPRSVDICSMFNKFFDDSFMELCTASTSSMEWENAIDYRVDWLTWRERERERRI
jgi:hypothetical protein